MKFIVAEIDEKGIPVGFYTQKTSADNLLATDLQEALVFEEKAIARQSMAIFQRAFLDKELSILPVEVEIKLSQ